MTHSDKRAYFFKIDTTIKKIRAFMQKNLTDADIDLTVDQWVVLDHIKPNPNICQNELANITCKDAPTMTRILGYFGKKGANCKEDVRRRQEEVLLGADPEW